MVSDLPFRHLLKRAEVTARNVSVSIVDVPAAIRTGYLPNTYKKRYHLNQLVL
jgi:hypothetical protein